MHPIVGCLHIALAERGARCGPLGGTVPVAAHVVDGDLCLQAVYGTNELCLGTPLPQVLRVLCPEHSAIREPFSDDDVLLRLQQQVVVTWRTDLQHTSCHVQADLHDVLVSCNRGRQRRKRGVHCTDGLLCTRLLNSAHLNAVVPVDAEPPPVLSAPVENNVGRLQHLRLGLIEVKRIQFPRHLPSVHPGRGCPRRGEERANVTFHKVFAAEVLKPQLPHLCLLLDQLCKSPQVSGPAARRNEAIPLRAPV
mmetsp:Transcript_13470/g.31640  ORF Transcript_13470/g.31640 Transcript_13470/m.31640 type:complete len:251 (-) Transcript_13470:1668-2420(-)